MIVRQEKTEDFPRIYELVKEGFRTAQVSNGKEQDFVDYLRNGANYIPELALVAEDNGAIVGHIMLTKTQIDAKARKIETLLLAPVTVELEHRKKGIGARLIDEAFRLAKNKGYASVVLVGNPAFYGRFGFKCSADFGIENANGIPDKYVQSCELVSGSLKSAEGRILFETGE